MPTTLLELQDCRKRCQTLVSVLLILLSNTFSQYFVCDFQPMFVLLEKIKPVCYTDMCVCVWGGGGGGVGGVGGGGGGGGEGETEIKRDRQAD